MTTRAVGPSILRRMVGAGAGLRVRTALVSLGFAALAAATLPLGGHAQTIEGRLLDLDGDQPIPLGLVMMYTESGDSIGSTVSDGSGGFRISAPDPGSFVLVAAALGYEERRAGVFELGAGGAMEVEYRLRATPLPLDALLVSVDRPLLDHHLVRNGFVRRFQRGLGKFVTPHDVRESLERSTEALLTGVPDVRVGTVRSTRSALALPMPHLGETVQIRSPTLGWCEPTVYVDGTRILYDPEAGFTLSQYAHIGDVDAMEVYRSPAEIPVEFSPTPLSSCGVLVVWTRQGTRVGRRADTSVTATDYRGGEIGGLPSVGTRGPAPVRGETIRVEVDSEVARTRGLASPWQGTFQAIDAGVLVGTDESSGVATALPLESVEALQVSRRKGSFDAWRRGAFAGLGMGLGTWGFLTLLCEFTCGPAVETDATLPAILAGVFVGGLVVSGGPGTHWVQAPPRPGAEGSTGAPDVELSIRLPSRVP